MRPIEKLVSISSEPLAPKPNGLPAFLASYALGPELFRKLQRKNGFYAFESALHVFPLRSAFGMSLEEWNADALWRNGYEDLAEGLLFFAEDIFQDQYCISSDGVLRFFAETGATVLLADTIENWAEKLLSDYKRETAWPLASQWQDENGPLPEGKRLMPKIPFFLGGEYAIENFWAGDSVEGMRFKANLAIQTRNLPSGSQVTINFTRKPTEQ